MLVVFSLLAHNANFDPGQSLDGNANTILDDAIVYSVDQIGRKTAHVLPTTALDMRSLTGLFAVRLVEEEDHRLVSG